MPKKEQRITAKELVTNAATRESTQNWMGSLSPEDRKYIYDVVAALKETPDVSLYIVAEKLIQTLNIKRHRQTVVSTLKGLLHAT